MNRSPKSLVAWTSKRNSTRCSHSSPGASFSLAWNAQRMWCFQHTAVGPQKSPSPLCGTSKMLELFSNGSSLPAQNNPNQAKTNQIRRYLGLIIHLYFQVSMKEWKFTSVTTGEEKRKPRVCSSGDQFK